jgi:hypothetical protein
VVSIRAGLREGTGSRRPVRCLAGEPSHHQPERDDHRPHQRRIPRGEHPHRHRRAEHQHPATAGRCPSWTAASSTPSTGWPAAGRRPPMARSPSPACALKPGCPGPPTIAPRSPQWSSAPGLRPDTPSWVQQTSPTSAGTGQGRQGVAAAARPGGRRPQGRRGGLCQPGPGLGPGPAQRRTGGRRPPTGRATGAGGSGSDPMADGI